MFSFSLCLSICLFLLLKLSFLPVRLFSASFPPLHTRTHPLTFFRMNCVATALAVFQISILRIVNWFMKATPISCCRYRMKVSSLSGIEMGEIWLFAQETELGIDNNRCRVVTADTTRWNTRMERNRLPSPLNSNASRANEPKKNFVWKLVPLSGKIKCMLHLTAYDLLSLIFLPLRADAGWTPSAKSAWLQTHF